MISLALLTGIYGYGSFFLGIARVLSVHTISVLSFFYFLSLTLVFVKNKHNITLIPRFSISTFLLLLIIFFQTIVNFIGVMGPEYSFDALWYHLVFPKLYLINHAVMHIPGGLLYYSDMPKLGEMFFTAALAFHSETVAKLIQFSFGILICILLYQFSKKYYSTFLSLIIVIVFY